MYNSVKFVAVLSDKLKSQLFFFVISLYKIKESPKIIDGHKGFRYDTSFILWLVVKTTKQNFLYSRFYSLWLSKDSNVATGIPNSPWASVARLFMIVRKEKFAWKHQHERIEIA